MRLLPCVLALSGCVFYAKDTTRIRVVSEDLAEVPIRTHRPVIQGRAIDATIRVFASQPRTCRRDRIEHLEITHGKTLGLYAADEDRSGYILLVGILLAPITLPISGLITAIAISSHKDTITTKDRVSENGFQPCPDLGVRTLQVAFPSGASTTVVSKRDGTVELALPAEEPDHGTVTLTSPGADMLGIEYFRTHELCEAERLARFESAIAATIDRAKRLEQIPRCHELTTGTARPTGVAWDLAVAAALAASRGDCRPAFDAEPIVKTADLKLHALAYGHPQLAGCMQKESARRQQITQCMQQRADAMRVALVIQNLQKRGEALRRIPQCSKE